MKLWDKDIPINQAVEQFTIGNDPEYDLLLAPYDIQGSLAHAQMLAETQLISRDEFIGLKQELKKIYQEIQLGQFQIDDGVEDVHSQVESLLTARVGQAGKKIHTGRSRNDQVLVDLKLYFREAIRKISISIRELAEQLLALAEKHREELLPGYTHLQAAMPSSFGLWFSAYAENLVDDLHIWSGAYKNINQNPLGSGAGYGGSLPLNRRRTTELLGFADLNYNVVHAQMTRGRSELFMGFGIATTANTLAKLAMDVCMYNSQDLAFLKLDDAFTTGSSIMPHKKNPDVFELIRARGNQLGQLPGQLAAMVGHLPSGYHRDFQLTKELIFPAIEQLNACLQMTSLALQNITVTKNILKSEKYIAIYSVELVNKMVLTGTPFREAYQKVAQDLANNSIHFPKKLAHTHEGSIGNLCLDSIRLKLRNALASIDFSYLKKIEALLQA